ncbi:uncharacterized protein hhla1 [Poecilia reticulata]|nr:PREDICTED: HERV-H LTR-associating protein 1 [Poecilia reticulata]
MAALRRFLLLPRLRLITCVSAASLLILFSRDFSSRMKDERHKRDFNNFSEIPAESAIDLTAIDLTPLVNTLINSSQSGTSWQHHHRSAALDLSPSFRRHFDGRRSLKKRRCWCETWNPVRLSSGQTSLSVDMMSNHHLLRMETRHGANGQVEPKSQKLLKLLKMKLKLLKMKLVKLKLVKLKLVKMKLVKMKLWSDFEAIKVQRSALTGSFNLFNVCVSVSQRNNSDCIYICVMAGKTGRELSGFWDDGSVTPLFNLTIVEGPNRVANISSIRLPAASPHLSRTSSTTLKVTTSVEVTPTSSRPPGFTAGRPSTETPNIRTSQSVSTPQIRTAGAAEATSAGTTRRPTNSAAAAPPAAAATSAAAGGATGVATAAAPALHADTARPPAATSAAAGTATGITAVTAPAPPAATARPPAATSAAAGTATGATAASAPALPAVIAQLPGGAATAAAPAAAPATAPSAATARPPAAAITSAAAGITAAPALPEVTAKLPAAIFAAAATAAGLTAAPAPPAATAALKSPDSLVDTSISPTSPLQTTFTGPSTLRPAETTPSSRDTTSDRAGETERPGCLWRRPEPGSEAETLGELKLQPCVLELCRFFSQCLCRPLSRTTRSKRYCDDSFLWYEEHTFEVCRRVKRVSFSRNLKQRCLSKMCNKL